MQADQCGGRQRSSTGKPDASFSEDLGMRNLNKGNAETCPFFCIPLPHHVGVADAFAALAMPSLARSEEGSYEEPFSAARETLWLRVAQHRSWSTPILSLKAA